MNEVSQMIEMEKQIFTCGDIHTLTINYRLSICYNMLINIGFLLIGSRVVSQTKKYRKGKIF
jgi:hypothetical protein